MALRGIFGFLRGQAEAGRADGPEQDQEPEQNDESMEGSREEYPEERMEQVGEKAVEINNELNYTDRQWTDKGGSPSELSAQRRINIEKNRERQRTIETKLNETFTPIEELEAIMDAGEAEASKTVVEYEGKPVVIYNTGNLPFRYLEHDIQYGGGRGDQQLMKDPMLWYASKEEAQKRATSFSDQLSFQYKDSIKRRGQEYVDKDEHIFYCFLHLPEMSLSQMGEGATGELVKKNNDIISLSETDAAGDVAEKISDKRFLELQAHRYDETGKPAFKIDFIRAPLDGVNEDVLRQAAAHGVPIFIIPKKHVLTKEEVVAEEARKAREKEQERERRKDELFKIILGYKFHDDEAYDKLDALMQDPYSKEWIPKLQSSRMGDASAQLRAMSLEQAQSGKEEYDTSTEDGFEANKKAELERANKEISFEIERLMYINKNERTEDELREKREKLEKLAKSSSRENWGRYVIKYQQLFNLVKMRDEIESSQFGVNSEEDDPELEDEEVEPSVEELEAKVEELWQQVKSKIDAFLESKDYDDDKLDRLQDKLIEMANNPDSNILWRRPTHNNPDFFKPFQELARKYKEADAELEKKRRS